MATSSTNFVNILTDLRKDSDLAYVLKSRHFPVLKRCRFRNAAQLKRDVLASERVRAAVNELIRITNCSKTHAEAEAMKICNEMFLNFDMKAVRILAYLAKKVLPRLFSAIYVDSIETIEKIRRLCVNDPVLFVPSHRSYMDFILLQFVCLHFEISLPAIASAIDFMNMTLFGELLRRSGAYFIRRSFKDNPLYLAIFTEYVQNLVLDGERPTEVFVEGTRSRTGKSLHPKHGFLSTILELFLSNRIFDILVVPVNLSYNKTLEEVLYAYELLGFTKPPESTSALLKARTVLDTNYGDVYITFCEPLSIRDYFDNAPGIDRSIRRTWPPFTFTDAEKRAIHLFSHKLIKLQESKAVLNLWMLVALEMNSMIAHNKTSSGQSPSINLNHLRDNVNRWYDVFSRLGCRIPLRTGSLTDEMIYYMNLHKNLVSLSECGRLLTLPAAPPPAGRAVDRSVEGVPLLIGFAVPRLILANFANQCMHVLVDLCFLALNFSSTNLNEFRKQQLREEFSFLKIFYGRDFVYEQTKINDVYEATLNTAIHARIFEFVSPDIIKVSNKTDVDALKRVFEPWIISYRMCVEFMIHIQTETDEKFFIRRMQEIICENFVSAIDSDRSAPKWHQILSSDTLKNALHSMVDVGVVKKVHSASGLIYTGDYVRLVDVKRRLDKYLQNCNINLNDFVKKWNAKSKL